MHELTPRHRPDDNFCLFMLLLMLIDVCIRFEELKSFHGIEDNRLSVGPAGPQKLASGLICMTMSES